MPTTTDTVPSPRLDRRFTLAPMMEWSTSDCRTFWRILTQRAVLYSEMVTTGALLYGDRKRFLDYNACEHPLALQLGGSDPRALAECARIAEGWGYDEVNLNCGCPSDRVQNGMIGACLMAEPQLVAECIAAMQQAVSIPVTVKHRIGIDDMDDYEGLETFVRTIAATGCNTFIVHARKAWLKGLSPKENREIPPLQYDKVYQLKQDFPHLNIIINGGITTLEQSQALLEHVDGVMVGREAYSNPYLLAQVDQTLYGESRPVISRDQVTQAFIAYCEEQLAKGARLNHLTRHILGLYQGQPGARQFRRVISEHAHKPGAGIEVIERALAALNEVPLAQSVCE
ncbi:tRNA dihydrouridine(20/20a) synthase DusA [Cellvibrio japonicus]|uniref:tRNA-dihydrouridine(20/20a) synthase n=1 Tax=Cellvibrio japonicus (strain Ueda107) TaxID=498211 RepID=B3PDN0_CELJU|nr:tRNA dihydrouridine(20/20a) synthase DusA [Cellvibrio japonicus]ACE83396.1 tRNA-dihydrouridine synthase A [Cellvibrio japonicus Ueda107]QEI12039.1 tRNA dihydrouridine(20/20a) synthase DusA [Cellvibrio japonicus]QEI15614.1 tRNA dihydrouridine(20/20a) synthase DusA [Cellvibrio japonicus]QEI19192.1 tRNA dihydrouridine(20/20a) synthase DusA [Cellvibrio japonicus]